MVKAIDYISLNTQVLYSRILYFLFPKKIMNLSKTRDTLAREVKEFTDIHITEVDSKYKEERILFREPITNETEYLIRRNSVRKITKESRNSIDLLLHTIS